MHRIAFYPCCGGDIAEPHHALAGIVDEIIYCDVSLVPTDNSSLGLDAPRRTFWQKDIRDGLNEISHIDVLFYRRDGTGEGGSGVFVLGKHILPLVLEKMSGPDCLIITDGSNSRGGTFRKMKRGTGLVMDGKHVTIRPEQRFDRLGVVEFHVRSATSFAVAPTSAPTK